MKKISENVDTILTSLAEVVVNGIKKFNDFEIVGKFPPLLMFEFNNVEGEEPGRGLVFHFDTDEKISSLEEVISSFALSLVAMERSIERVSNKKVSGTVKAITMMSSAICVEGDSSRPNDKPIEESAVMAMTMTREGNVFANSRTIHRTLDEQLGIVPAFSIDDEIDLSDSKGAFSEAWCGDKRTDDPVRMFWKVFREAEAEYAKLTTEQKLNWNLNSIEFLTSALDSGDAVNVV